MTVLSKVQELIGFILSISVGGGDSLLGVLCGTPSLSSYRLDDLMTILFGVSYQNY